MRLPTVPRRAVLKSLTLTAALAVLPVGTATAGKWFQRDCPPGSAPSGNIVYRPAFPAARQKTFYLSNYAGVNYPPVGRRSRLEPTVATYRGQAPCPDCAAGRHSHH